MVQGTKRKRDESLPVDLHQFERATTTIDPTQQDVIFQILDCEDASKDKSDADASLVRLHGTTEQGESIIVLVRNFHQYLYFPVTSKFTSDDFAAFEEAIQHNTKVEVAIDSMEIVQRDPLEFFRENPENYRRYVKIYVGKPTDVNPIGQVLSKSDELPKLLNMYQSGKLHSSQIYETGLSFDMRFMIDLGLVGCGWAKLEQGQYKTFSKQPPYDRVSHVFECDQKAIVGLSPDSTTTDDIKTKEYSKLANFRILLVACLNMDSNPIRKGSSTPNSPKKPKPKTSKIVAKSKKVSSVEDDEPEPFIATISMVFTDSPLEASSNDRTIVLKHGLNTTATLTHIPNVEVMCLQSEKEMLSVFRDLLLTYDPDVISGYDITSEAIPTILARGLDLGLPKDFINLARCSHTALKTKRRQIYSGAWIKKERKMAATSNREHTELGCIGRLVLDLRSVIEREERLRTYSLNETTAYITGRTLEKLSDSSLLELWNSSASDDHARLVDYSLGEVDAATNIMRKHASLITYIELSRVTGLTFEDVVSRGQMRRFWSQLFRFCRARGVIVPGKNRNGEQMTQSALNYMPDVGYDTENPVIVLDFKSLYPSILIARNMCFSTELTPGDPFQGETWTAYGGTKFVASTVKEGIVPQILKHFLSERVRVKSLMKETTDPGIRQVLDGRQKAIKVVANAVYGFFGARESNMQNLAIADGTITEGARLLEEAKQEIEKRYNSVAGTTNEVKCVYGDTDSCFIRVYNKSVQEAIDLGKKISHEVSQIWPHPIQLDFEKVLFPTLLQNRKRYAGLLWTKADKPDEIDVKGIEVNRRDAVPLINSVIGDIFTAMFPYKNNSANDGPCSGKILPEDRAKIVSTVKELVVRDVNKILAGDLDVGSFILTKGLWLGTNASDYSAKQTHISVIDKIRSRDSRRMFKDGERISYVFTQSTPNAKGYEKAEDPVYAINKGLLLDYAYYLDHTVHNPLQRILELFMTPKEIESLFKVTKTSKIPVSKASGVMGAFLSAAKKSSSKCEVCGTQCDAGKLCSKHKADGKQLAETKKVKVETLSKMRDERHSTCHACQRSERAILCVNMDCDIYFSRKRLDEETGAAEDDLDNFTKAEGIKIDW